MRLYIFVIFAIWLCGSTNAKECSKAVSRTVRTFLNNDVYRRLGIDASDLPDNCDLNPRHDMYGVHEHSKMEESPGEWKVGSLLCCMSQNVTLEISVYSLQQAFHQRVLSRQTSG